MCCKKYIKNGIFLFLHLFITCQQKQFIAKENCIGEETLKCKKYINVSPAVFRVIILLYFDKRALQVLVPFVKINIY